jgi:hypothetical protein
VLPENEEQYGERYLRAVGCSSGLGGNRTLIFGMQNRRVSRCSLQALGLSAKNRTPSKGIQGPYATTTLHSVGPPGEI